MQKYHCNYLDQLSSNEKFEIIKRVTSLINELFKDKEIKANL